MEPATGPGETGAASSGIAGREYKKLGYSLYVWVSPDGLECRCSYIPNEQGSMITREEVLNCLAQSSVHEGIDQTSLDDFAIKAAAGQNQLMVLIASGTPPVHGKDSYLEYLIKPSVTVVHDVDEARDVDYHNVQTFINVIPGEEIGTIVPPEPGLPGRSVRGQVIPSQAGKPLKLKIGQNISLEGDLLKATTAGRVVTISDEISVAEEYVISGDVGFRVGSIVFNGFVEIRGDILDGFNVTAVKGLKVIGNIGACAIKSGGDVFFCGMDGQEKGTIECGGSIVANFIHDSLVECNGSVSADVELHNCHIKSLGRILVNKGAIAGGSYTALGGIETKKAGSASSVKTVLRAGIDYRDMSEFERLLGELEANGAKTKEAGTLQELEQLRKERTEFTDRLMEIRNKTHATANAKVNVKSMLYDNTYLCIGMTSKQKVDEREGPFSVIENTIEGGLRFLSMTGLDVKATDIELAFVREQALKR